MNGHPPKSVRVRVGNSSVVEIETFIRSRIERILEFDANQYEAHLNLT